MTVPEHEAIAYAATVETLEALLAKCNGFLSSVEFTMKENTPDKCASDQSRDYIMARSYNEGSSDMARLIRDAIREKIEDERQYYAERQAGYEEEAD